ncbi:MAG: ferrichrome ABC transporter substrate-binding protein [Mediterranea sp.]|nr:ferrichrome ABC transporter substrate-binding protein [Mediterranea sp.]
MDDFWNILIIVGVVLIGIIKEVGKKKTQEQALPRKSHLPHVPTADEVAPDATPVPWGRTGMLDDLLQPIPFEQTPASSPINSPSKKTAHPSTVPKTTPHDSPYIPITTAEETTEDFRLHSAEQARRAIVWSEILQRKY